MLTKTRMVMESSIEERTVWTLQADAGMVDYRWLSRWRRDNGLSLRQPSRKF